MSGCPGESSFALLGTLMTLMEPLDEIRYY